MINRKVRVRRAKEGEYQRAVQNAARVTEPAVVNQRAAEPCVRSNRSPALLNTRQLGGLGFDQTGGYINNGKSIEHFAIQTDGSALTTSERFQMLEKENERRQAMVCTSASWVLCFCELWPVICACCCSCNRLLAVVMLSAKPHLQSRSVTGRNLKSDKVT